MWPCRHACRCVHFYPRPPRGGRPGAGRQSWLQGYFYPRPPRGGRHIADIEKTPEPIFLSTPSARRATEDGRVEEAVLTISIHALREEGDPTFGQNWTRLENFYPRPPRGGRRVQLLHDAEDDEISIHALREEGDQVRHGHPLRRQDFYPRPPRGGRPSIQ